MLENHVSTSMAKEKGGPPHLIDVAAWLPQGSGMFGGQPVPAKSTLRMDLGDGSMKEVVSQPSTGGAFPLTVSKKGTEIDVFKAQASRAEDRKRILHLIAGTAQESLEDEPPAECAAYTEMNRQARRMFAAGAMYGATLRGDMSELNRLVSEHPVQGACISDGATPLYAAAWKGNLHALRALVQAKANPNAVKQDGASPLFIAAENGNHEIIRELIQANADVNLAGPEGVMPIFKAIRCSGDGASVKMMVLAKADVDAEHKGWTPLLLASDLGAIAPLKILLAGKANPNQILGGNTPLGLAKKKGHTEVVAALADVGATKDRVAKTEKKKVATPSAFGQTFAESGLDTGALTSLAGSSSPAAMYKTF